MGRHSRTHAGNGITTGAGAARGVRRDGPPLKRQTAARAFATSDEHTQYLLAQSKGGTRHSAPRWDGDWIIPRWGNTHLEAFIDGPGGLAGKVREGVLTPTYEKAYKQVVPAGWRKARCSLTIALVPAARHATLPARAVHTRVHQPAD